MEISLVSNAALCFQLPFTKDQQFSLNTHIKSTNPSSGSSSKRTESFDRFLSAFNKKYPNFYSLSKLDINFKAKKTGTEPFCKKTEAFHSTIVIQGELLSAVQQVLCSAVEKDILQLQITLQSQGGFSTSTYSTLHTPKSKVTLEGFFPQICDGSFDHSVYKKSNTEIPILTNDTTQRWYISVAVKKDLFISLDGLLPSCSKENRKRFMEKDKFADYKILVEGKEILCNKIFLASMSPVMRTEIESEFKEGKNDESEVEGFSYDGITALLKFMYYLDVSDAMLSCKIALELYRAADFYKIEALSRVIGFILLEKPLEWYKDADVALALLQFLQKLETVDEDQKNKIKEKMFKVLSLKISSLSDSKLLEELYPNEDGRESFMALLELHKP